MKWFLTFLLVVFLFPQTALSKEKADYYFSATGGLLFSDNMGLNGSTTSRVDLDYPRYNIQMNFRDAKAKFDTGSSSIVAVGKTLGSFFRAEFEYGYRQASFDTVDGILTSIQIQSYSRTATKRGMDLVDRENAAALEHGGYKYPFNGTGDISIHSVMANLLLDFPNKTAIIPYLGGGVGVAFWDYDYSVVCGLDSISAIYGDEASNGAIEILADDQRVGPLQADENGTDFAFQLMTGVALDFTDNIKGIVGYRMFGINGDLDYMSHSAEVGIRYAF